jgi:hypothetical protein
MFATAEEKLIVGALSSIIVLVGILGFIHHERFEGATVCVQQQSKAAAAETQKDTIANESVIKDFSGDLASIPITASHTPMLMCSSPGSVRQVAAATGVKPATVSNSTNDSGVRTGTKPVAAVDIGPAVQDITFGCVLGITDATELWQLATKESTP